MKWSLMTAVLAAATLAAGCGGETKPAKGKSGKGGGKKPPAEAKAETASPAKKAYDELVKHRENTPEDFAGFRERAAKVKPQVSGTPVQREFDDFVAEVEKSRREVLKMTLDKIGEESQDPANLPHPQRYLDRLTKLEGDAAATGTDIAQALAPGIATWRAKLFGNVYKTDVSDFERSHREEVDEIDKRIAAFREKVKSAGEAVKPLLEALDADQARVADRREWLKRTPAADWVDLLESGASDGWKSVDHASFQLSGGLLTLKGTAEGKGSGLVYAAHSWWRDFEAELTFTIVSEGFQLVARANPPKFGYAQPVSSRTFGTGKEVNLTLKVVGSDVTLGGDIEPATSTQKAIPTGGGIGFFLGAGSEVKVTKLRIRALK
ncbi:MAG: hypothetical protein L0216_16295 [Planctomycetales bacterium]|nr:hypothetical protein [Planctomycetales bacterium]